MITDTLAYGIKPRGHRMPPARRGYDPPHSEAYEELKKFFEIWMKSFHPEGSYSDIEMSYSHACDYMRDLKKRGLNPSADYAHAIVLVSEKPQIERVGPFLSAVYNHSDERVIVYDLDIAIDYLGISLPENKVFVNYGNTGISMGRKSRGIVVNCGKAGRFMVEKSSGIVLNLQQAGDWMGCNSEAIIINCHTTGPRIGDGSKGVIIDSASVTGGLLVYSKRPFYGLDGLSNTGISELEQYIGALRDVFEKGRHDYSHIQRYFMNEAEPAHAVRSQIEGILGGVKI